MKLNIVHITNRGVDKRNIFLKTGDYERFIYNLYDFNNRENVLESYHRRRKMTLSDIRHPTDEIVDVLCWTLMKNHFHVLVAEKTVGGAALFSRKITGGYTKSFNEDQKRSGVLFQGKSKIIPIKQDEHFVHLPYYILANPISLIEPGWKDRGIKNIKKITKFLENYKYSSFVDLTGGKNYPFIVNKDAFYEFYDTNEKQFKKDFIAWLVE